MQRSIIAPAERVTNLRWGIAVLLGIGVLVNYFDRVNLTAAQASLHAEFGIDDIAFGYLLSAYSWTYAAMQIPIGVILDRFGVVFTGRWSSLLWSVSSALTALSTGFGTFFASRLLLGIGEAPTFPINAKATGYWFPIKERGLATAIFDSAAKIATGIAVPVVFILLAAYGWRVTFIVTAILSLAFFAAFYLFYRNPSEDKRLTYAERQYIVEGGAQPEGQTNAGSVGDAFWYLISQRKVWGLTLGFSAYGYSFYLLLTWLPSYLVKTYQMGGIKTGAYAMIPWIVAGIADLIVGGWLVDSLIRRGFDANRVRKTIIVIGMTMGLTIVFATMTRDVNVAVFWLTVALTGLACTAPIGWSIPALIAPKGSVGTIGGIMNFFNNCMGIAAPIVTGYIVAGTASFTNAFITAAVVLLIGIISYIWILGRIEPIPEPA